MVPIAGNRATADLTIAALREEIVGIATRVPILDGSEQPYVFLDNAASTPAFRHVLSSLVERSLTAPMMWWAASSGLIRPPTR